MTQRATKSRRAEPRTPWQLAVTLHCGESSPEVGRELVRDDDLLEARSEAWFNGILRRGDPGLPFESTQVHLEPVRSQDGARYSGFALETRTRQGVETRHEFSVRSLHQVATRGAQRLMQLGILPAGELYYYELSAEPATPSHATPSVTPSMPQSVAPSTAPATVSASPARDVDARALGMKFEKQIQPMHVLSVPLEGIRRQARHVGPVDERDYPVFYTEATFEKAERYARAGVVHPQPVETGAVLLGSLCSCPDSGEMFVVITDALEAADTEQTKFSLAYSGKTWLQIQSVVRAMQRRPETRALRIVGQCHGHNFLPLDGAPPCENCDKLEVCGRTTVFVSADDQDWNRAVFSRQPWQLCHIFGLNARQENVQGLFGLRDGRLLERGYSIIPSFEPLHVGGHDARRRLAARAGEATQVVNGGTP